jgi:hypothetical protein
VAVLKVTVFPYKITIPTSPCFLALFYHGEHAPLVNSVSTITGVHQHSPVMLDIIAAGKQQ